jgi:hypothetical protein
MTVKDEERIRRIIRRAVVLSHDEESDQDVGPIFDLLPYLKPEAGAVAADETTLALADLLGSD